jgi:hypothetical protein
VKKLPTPKLRAPKIRGPKIRGPQIRTPQVLNNLYRDMRDRRLLLPALALLVALIAVPAMLKSTSSSAPTPSPPVPSGSDQPTAAEPAVLARQLGVTNYRKRLDALNSKNPFRQHFTELPKGAKLNTTSSASSSTTTTSSATSTSSPTVPVEPSSSTASGATSSSTSTSTSPTVSTSPPATHGHHHKPQLFYVKRRIDVKVGPQGDVVRKNGVKQLSFLPNGATPLVAYLGANEAGTRAFFDLSSDVTSASGDGRCLPSASTCRFVALKQGEVEKFDYAPHPGTPYKLKLLAIRNVVTNNLGGTQPKPKRSAGMEGSSGASRSLTPVG